MPPAGCPATIKDSHSAFKDSRSVPIIRKRPSMIRATEAEPLLITFIDALAAAEELFSLGETAQAREQLEALRPLTLHVVGLHSQVLTDLAVIAAQAGSRDEAIELANEALVHRPDHGPALEVLAHFDRPAPPPEPVTRGYELSVELQSARIEQFQRLSTCQRVTGEPGAAQPVLLVGNGRITFGEGVRFGWFGSPGFLDQYAYVEACHDHTHVEVGDNTTFNNGVTLRAEGPGISIGRDCLFGWSVQVLDSDFHDLHPRRRTGGTPATGHVRIGNNAFVGANTIVMKGVTIGDDTVVGAGSVVLRSLPSGVIAAGNPARVIRALEDD
jgi:galactoside O-acetyltransferase